MFMLTIMPYRARNDRSLTHVMLINSGYTSLGAHVPAVIDTNPGHRQRLRDGCSDIWPIIVSRAPPDLLSARADHLRNPLGSVQIDATVSMPGTSAKVRCPEQLFWTARTLIGRESIRARNGSMSVVADLLWRDTPARRAASPLHPMRSPPVRPAGLANSPIQTQPSLLHTGLLSADLDFVQREPPTRPSGGLARSGLCRPVPPVDVQVDGQTILRTIRLTYNKRLTCIPGRDGGIRTRGLLLPKLGQPRKGHHSDLDRHPRYRRRRWISPSWDPRSCPPSNNCTAPTATRPTSTSRSRCTHAGRHLALPPIVRSVMRDDALTDQNKTDRLVASIDELGLSVAEAKAKRFPIQPEDVHLIA